VARNVAGIDDDPPSPRPPVETARARPLQKFVQRSPCASHFMDGRLVRGLVGAEDPTSRVIGPWIAKMARKTWRAAAALRRNRLPRAGPPKR